MVSLIPSVSPIVGNVLEMRPSLMQASLDRKSLLVTGVMYIICLVVMGDPVGDTPVMRNGMAPSISIPLLLAAVMCMLTGMR